MKKIFLLLSLVMTFLLISIIGSNNAIAQKKPVVLRLVVSTPPNEYPLGYSLEEMAKKFNERAKNEYKMEVHAGGALAKLPEYFDAVRIGAVEMASGAWTIFSFLDPRLGVHRSALPL